LAENYGVTAAALARALIREAYATKIGSPKKPRGKR